MARRPPRHPPPRLLPPVVLPPMCASSHAANASASTPPRGSSYCSVESSPLSATREINDPNIEHAPSKQPQIRILRRADGTSLLNPTPNNAKIPPLSCFGDKTNTSKDHCNRRNPGRPSTCSAHWAHHGNNNHAADTGTDASADSLFLNAPALSAGDENRDRFICFVDIEASGPSLVDNFMPCLGLAVVRLGTLSRPPLVVRSYKWFVRAPSGSREWNEGTLRDFWLQDRNAALYKSCIEALGNTAVSVDPSTAMHQFVAACREVGGDATLVSDTTGFDVSWLYYYLSHYGPPECPSPSMLFGKYRVVRDISSFFAGLGGPGAGGDGSSIQTRYPHRGVMQKWGLAEAEWCSFSRRNQCPSYDHDPEHDAAHVGLRSAWILWMVELRMSSAA